MSVVRMSRAGSNMEHYEERVDLACAFRWAARLGLHEAVANHFSLGVGGGMVLINPDRRHFSRLRASDMLLIDVNDDSTPERDDAPDPTAWGLHGAIHRECGHVGCAMHVHSVYATVLACLEDSRLPPLEQSAAMFHDRLLIDEGYDGLAFAEEGARCAAMLNARPECRVMVMGNHGVLVVGPNVAETFDYLFYFERACEIYVKALSTGRPLRVMSDEVASRVVSQIENYPVEGMSSGERHFSELRLTLDEQEPEYRE